MKRLFLTAFLALAPVTLFPASGALLRAQTAPATFYTQSFRQGPTHVTEQTFEAKLDPQNPVFRQRIKDAHGGDRYLLTLAPQGPEGDNKITSWRVKLADLHHVIYDNILLASQEPSSDAANNLWRLEPRNFAAVPIAAQRIIKVDSFYVTIEVKAYHFTPVDSPYLDSMTVQVKFSNTDPRPPGS
jgi:hypothetical protein